MEENVPTFGGSMAESYDRYLVPILFRPYAKDLAHRLPQGFKGTVLELACGTAAVTEEVMKRVDEDAEIIATDLSERMLAYARAKHSESDRVKWDQADAQSLHLPDASCDFILCQFGAMFFPDKVLAFREAKRVLKPGGKLIFNVWGSFEENPVFHSIELGLGALFPDEPTPILPTPVNMADADGVEAKLREAGFTTIHVDRVQFAVKGFHAHDVVFGFVGGTPVSTFLKEKGLAAEDSHARLLPLVVQKLGNPIDTTMLALVFEVS